MPLYRTSGKLIHRIETGENVALAQAYLTQFDMTQFLDDDLEGQVEHVEWKLEGDGESWSVTAYCVGVLIPEHLKVLSSWVSGQNSDGLGEGFEQQEFAQAECEGCDECEPDGRYGFCENGSMCSFDWETNDCTFVRVK